MRNLSEVLFAVDDPTRSHASPQATRKSVQVRFLQQVLHHKAQPQRPFGSAQHEQEAQGTLRVYLPTRRQLRHHRRSVGPHAKCVVHGEFVPMHSVWHCVSRVVGLPRAHARRSHVGAAEDATLVCPGAGAGGNALALVFDTAAAERCARRFVAAVGGSCGGCSCHRRRCRWRGVGDAAAADTHGTRRSSRHCEPAGTRDRRRRWECESSFSEQHWQQ